MPKVAIIEPKLAVRSDLIKYVGRQPPWELTGTYGDCQQALQCIIADNPKVVILSLDLPGMSALSCLRAIKQVLPKVHCIAYSPVRTWEEVKQIIQLVNSFVTLEEGEAGVYKALRMALQRKTYLSPTIATMVVNNFHDQKRTLGVFRRLSEREMEIVHVVSGGGKYQQLGPQLEITEGGLRQHVHRICSKVGVSGRTELMLLYLNMLNGRLPEEE